MDSRFRHAHDDSSYDCTAQHSTAQHSTAQHSTAQHSTAQYLHSCDPHLLKHEIKAEQLIVSHLFVLSGVLVNCCSCSGARAGDSVHFVGGF